MSQVTEHILQGTIVGPPTASALKRVLGSGNVAIQGIGESLVFARRDPEIACFDEAALGVT